MNSIKSTVTVLFLLFVSYGVYRVIHTPDPVASSDGQFVVNPQSSTPNATVDSKSGGDNSVSNSRQNTSLTTPPRRLIDDPSKTELSTPDASVKFPVPPPLKPDMSTASISTSDTPVTGNAQSNAISGFDSPPPLATDATTMQQDSSNSPGGNSLIAAINSALPGSVVPASTRGNAESSSQPATPVANAKILTGPLTAVAPPSQSTADSSTPFSRAAAQPATNPLATNNTSDRDATAFPGAPMQPSTTAPTAADLDATWPTIRSLARNGDATSALRQLTQFYRSELPAAQREELLKWLDALASKVIYSTENLLQPTPYIVQSNDTLDSISNRWHVPKQLIVNVNRTKLPANGQFVPGLELKAIPGPFRAEIDCTHSELTLFLGDLYAGRFPIDTANCDNLGAKRYSVASASVDERTGNVMFLDLGGELTISTADSQLPNSLVLSDADANDVFGILSKSSDVTILR